MGSGHPHNKLHPCATSHFIAKLSNWAVFQPVPIPAMPFVWLVSVTFATEAPSMLTWIAEPLKPSARWCQVFN